MVEENLNMLPVDSPRWAKLRQAIGTAEEIADSIKAMYDCLNSDSATVEQICEAASAMEIACEGLNHQQSVYDGSGAAIPHFVEIANRLPIDAAIDLLVFVAYMTYESPQYRLDDDDLLEWYENAVARAKEMILNLARSSKAINVSDETGMFEAVAILHNHNDCFYAIRDHYSYDFSCPGCEAKLVAYYKDGKQYQVWKKADEPPRGDIAENLRIIVTPTSDISKELELPYHVDWKFFYELFAAGAHQYMLHWIKQLLGWFPCPGCQEMIQMRYKWNDD